MTSMPRVLTLPADGPVVADERAATDLLGEAFGAEAEVVVMPVERLAPAFFELRSGLAGAVTQKFVTYRVRLVVLGDVSAHTAASEAVAGWVREANRGRDLWFVADRDELERRLASDGR